MPEEFVLREACLLDYVRERTAFEFADVARDHHGAFEPLAPESRMLSAFVDDFEAGAPQGRDQLSRRE